MRKLIILTAAALSVLAGTGAATAEVTVLNKTDRILDIRVEDKGGDSWGKSFRLQTGEKETHGARGRDGVLEIRSMESKTRGDVILKTNYRDKEVVTIRSNDEGTGVNIRKTRKF